MSARLKKQERKRSHINKKGGENTKVFIAGGQQKNGKLLTSGGRVLAVSAFGNTFDEAFKAAYAAMDDVSFEGMFFRKDIGLPGAAESGEL